MTWHTQILTLGSDPNTDPALDQASALLAQDELVAFPTETVYGLGGNALSAKAVAKIFEAKQRPSDNPLIVHLPDRAAVAMFSDSKHPLLEPLAAAFWPGPLTLVLPARPEARDTVCRGLASVAVRVPNHPLALALLRRCGLGLAAPSANLSGRPSPTRASHVYQDLQGRIPLVLDGGPCQIGIESTVLYLCDDQPLILRPGSITAADLAKVLGFEPAYSSEATQQHHSPGTRYRHYSPNLPVLLIDPTLDAAVFQRLLQQLQRRGPVGYLGSRPVEPTPPGLFPLHRVETQPQTLPAQLYHVLREWETHRCGFGLVDAVAAEGEGRSLMDRLSKAASHHLVDEAAAQVFLSTLPALPT